MAGCSLQSLVACFAHTITPCAGANCAKIRPIKSSLYQAGDHIKLSQFNVSAVDLDPHRLLFVETQHELWPVTELQFHAQHLFLVTSAVPTKPLTLEQFESRTQQLSSHLALFANPSAPQPLFGYRLQPHQLIFG
ncbi:hypothetical protein M3M35_02090 [Fructilactobacillus myrtifloralis]|uniref:Uncharacterized protein n=1 Tax=Fructilactobacillus myrtifloralis TaxID=2940301 RepID=A0ABY5BRE0_9LACO|nr:hypothetical protein [Fructilactobacillus myrtifloralis]USS85476.1 hypothetical protein M3M35_02090 [Fructilactobacillus myrtifloralis]